MAKRTRRRRRSWGRTLLLIVFAAAALYAGFHCFFRPPEQKQEEVVPVSDSDTNLTDEEQAKAQAAAAHTRRKDDFYTILISGVDDGNGNSDTNILLAVDVAGGTIHGVSIPRDTKAVWNGKNHKINAAYGSGGMEKLADTISDQLGIPVDYTVSVNLKGFVALVDAIGGIDFNVPIDMNYDDPYQNLSIHFKAGMQHLNGQEALEVVRFRHNSDGTGYGSEDIGRMQTQQAFLKAVASKALTLSNIDSLVQVFFQYVDTDLTIGNLAWLADKVLAMGTENISFSTLPNEWHSPYIYLDQEGTLEMINQYLNPYEEDRLPEDLNIPSMPS